MEMLAKIRPELYAKYDAQSLRATTVSRLIEIISGIEANEAYIRNLIGKGKGPERSHCKDTEMPDIGQKRDRGYSGLTNQAPKRPRTDANSTPIGPRADHHGDYVRKCWICGSENHVKPQCMAKEQTAEGKKASEEHSEYLRKRGRPGVSVNAVRTNIEQFISESEN